MTDTSDALVQPAPPEIDEETAAVLARDLWACAARRGRSAVIRTATS